MKNLKMSFAAVVAVIAIGISIAAQAGAFETKKLPTACFGPDVQLKQFNDCTINKDVVVNTLCSVPQQDDHVFALGSPVINPEQVCTGSNRFCCLTLAIDLNPCIAQGQPELSFPGETDAYYKVATILCRPVIIP